MWFGCVLCTCSWGCMYVDMHEWLYVCGGMMSFLIIRHFLLRQGPFSGLRGQSASAGASGLPLNSMGPPVSSPLSPQHWGYRCLPMLPAFTQVPGIQTEVSLYNRHYPVSHLTSLQNFSFLIFFCSIGDWSQGLGMPSVLSCASAQELLDLKSTKHQRMGYQCRTIMKCLPDIELPCQVVSRITKTHNDFIRHYQRRKDVLFWSQCQ